MHINTLKAFRHELEKQALSPATLTSYLGARAAQGVGGAAALGKSLAGSTATTSRSIVQGMTGLQKHRLTGVLEGGQAVRSMQQLPQRVGLQQAAQQTRARVGQAIQQEAAAGMQSSRGPVPLSKAYEGYMSPATTSYTPQHVEQVMGLPQGSHTPKVGPTALMRPQRASAGETTVPAQSGVRPTRQAVDPHAVTQIAQEPTAVQTMPTRLKPRLQKAG